MRDGTSHLQVQFQSSSMAGQNYRKIMMMMMMMTQGYYIWVDWFIHSKQRFGVRIAIQFHSGGWRLDLRPCLFLCFTRDELLGFLEMSKDSISPWDERIKDRSEGVKEGRKKMWIDRWSGLASAMAIQVLFAIHHNFKLLQKFILKLDSIWGWNLKED